MSWNHVWSHVEQLLMCHYWGTVDWVMNGAIAFFVLLSIPWAIESARGRLPGGRNYKP